MEKIMGIKEFEERVCQYVRNALPYELEGSRVYVTRLEVGEGETRLAVLVIRPWSEMISGFCLHDFYKDYANGSATVESVAAAIINDRRLYKTSD